MQHVYVTERGGCQVQKDCRCDEADHFALSLVREDSLSWLLALPQAC